MGEGTARAVDAWCKVVGVLALVIGGTWTVYTYFNARSAEARTASIEAKKPFFAKRLDIYIEIVDLASQLASIADDHGMDLMKNPKGAPRADYEKKKERFEELSLGLLALVADQSVKEADVKFFNCLEDPQLNPDLRQCNLSALAHGLASACKLSISTEWQVPLASEVVTKSQLEDQRK